MTVTVASQPVGDGDWRLHIITGSLFDKVSVYVSRRMFDRLISSSTVIAGTISATGSVFTAKHAFAMT